MKKLEAHCNERVKMKTWNEKKVIAIVKPFIDYLFRLMKSLCVFDVANNRWRIKQKLSLEIKAGFGQASKDFVALQDSSCFTLATSDITA